MTRRTFDKLRIIGVIEQRRPHSVSCHLAYDGYYILSVEEDRRGYTLISWAPPGSSYGFSSKLIIANTLEEAFDKAVIMWKDSYCEG